MKKSAVKGFSVKGNRREVMKEMAILKRHHRTTGDLIRSMTITRSEDEARAHSETTLWVFPPSFPDRQIRIITGGA